MIMINFNIYETNFIVSVIKFRIDITVYYYFMRSNGGYGSWRYKNLVENVYIFDKEGKFTVKKQKNFKMCKVEKLK